jgi:bifunctional UDP-N-acetylglucosamine pyrophosphorylase / glucosamine-1-phosphate N-acetyltransferase
MDNIAGVVLAAGKGKRMGSKTVNKVTFPLNGKPMILHTIDLLEKAGVNPVVVVVGFARESVVEKLDKKIIVVNQSRRLGTAHAVMSAIKKIPNKTKRILVLNGDDSAFFPIYLIKKIIKEHMDKKSSFSFLSIEINNPAGLGRVLRNKGNVIGIVEDKDASQKQKETTEINPGCYVFDVNFLNRYLKKIKKSKITNEYYLTSLIDIAIKNKEKIVAVNAGKIPWRGINTREELLEAERLFLQKNSYENKN